MAKADLDQDVAKLEEQIALLRADMARIAETLSALGQTSGDTLRETIAAKAEAFRAQGEAKLAEAGQSAEATLDSLTDYARRKPLHAMAMAGGLGLLLGLVFGRR